MTAPTIATRTRRDPWRIAAVALLPIMVLGLLLAALWNPQDRLDQVPAAIVNLDEPVEVQGQTVPLGRQLASGLVSGGETAEGAKAAQPAEDATNFDWTITDEESAADGLANGTYAAVVTIPEDFSAAATSYGNDDPSEARQATIDVSTPPGGRVADDALARVVAATATSVMSSTLTEAYVDNVLVGFNELSDGIGQAQDGAVQLADGAGDAADGADQLADGAGQLADGAGDAADGASQLADGAGQLASGATSAATGASGVASGASGLADGAGKLASGSSQVADGARGIAGGIGESAAGADDLAKGGDDLAAGATQVAQGNRALADGVAELNQNVPDVASLKESLDDAQDRADEFASAAGAALGCDATPGTEACQALFEALAGLEEDSSAVQDTIDDVVSAREQLDALATQTDQLASGAEGVATGIGGIADGNRDLAKGLRQLQGGASQVADGADGVASGAGELSGGAGQLASGASQLSSGVGQLATGASGVASGATDLSTGVGQLATGTEGIATGAGDLAGGVGQLASGAGDLSDGLDDAKNQIPTYTDDERQTLSSVVAEPVAAPSASGISTGASGPLFAVMALWLGALALMTVFPPVMARALGSTRDSVRLALSAFWLPGAVGAGTGALVGVILAAVEKLDAGGWVGAILVGAVASVAFVAVHQGFLGWLGNLGRGISLLIAVLLIATGVVATVPAALQGLVDALPIGAARDALTAVVVPAAGGLGMSVTLLVLWGLGGLALAALVTARGRRLGVGRLLRA
ncbi:YhgE/Pip domain-containing protein [Isoptericola sp. NPDC019482]|uniref:YhgE/Pip domain-containing protein n=1 Tax=Isoptericola sp. NPDC019482 TaxID=3154688 RepID=UPI00349A4F95